VNQHQAFAPIYLRKRSAGEETNTPPGATTGH
jgi:hypothetical protein